ncbi:MAG: rRNA maturation RNase YbeY [Dehalococcoidia bacterium]|nr:rRNA maturation RNase YbeY [Dehalococcoidia bacterium]MQG09376.1 rRNA maturation RNase YbeY [SAR202 cluster bacterium]|tara:strand:- start:10544 stop:11020 length:477 start_codon:yes stop_codon:yes gene_type:complete
MSHKIEIFDKKKLISENLDIKPLIIKACILTLKLEEISKPKLLSINFTDDKEMALLNNKYMGHNETTDVLSFNEISIETQQKYNWPKEETISQEKIGEIIISVPQVRKQCMNDFNHECVKLVVHGLLHILGYDHALKKEELIMFNKTDDILSYIFKKN